MDGADTALDSTVAEAYPAAGGLVRGAAIGRYVVLDHLGSGATGTVYAAYDPELARKVALKVLAREPGAGGEQQWLRLRREAQALAQLTNEHVVSVYDVGVVELGEGDQRVYLGMQFVDGADLARWLAERGAPRTRRQCREIVEVFVQAGRGLAAAHAVGLVHRDFKPANVLIGKDGTVRVADFGLARAPTTSTGESAAELTPDDIETTSPLLDVAMTDPGLLVGTPPYMAPEQFKGGPIDARTDQFSFCVALHEALYGERPFSGRTVGSVRRSILRGEIRPPPADAHVPARLRRIVLRGLSAAPADRYPSMDALVADLLRDPATRLRRAAPVASLVVAAGALAVAGLVRRESAAEPPCRHAASRLAGVWNAERAAAVRRAMLATNRPYAPDVVDRLTTRLDAYFDGWVTSHTDTCEATYVRTEQSEEVLDLRMRCLDRRLSEAGALVTLLAAGPDVDVLDRSIDAVAKLAGPELCVDVEALRAVVPPPADPAVRAQVEELSARLDEIEALADAGKYARGLERVRAVSDQAEAIGHPPLTARALAARASLEELGGDYPASEATYYRAARAAGAAHDDDLMAEVFTGLLLVVGERERQPESAAALARIAEAVVARAGDAPAARAALYGSQGHVLNGAGRYQEAEVLYRRALEEQRRLFGSNHPLVAWSLNSVGTALYNQRRREEAKVVYNDALAIAERVLGRDHPHVAIVLGNLGHVYEQLGDYDTADAVHQRALAIRRASIGPDHPLVANSLHGLGRVAEARGDYPAAGQYYQQAYDIDSHTMGADHPEMATYINDLGDVALHLDDLPRALSYYQRAAALVERGLGPEHPELSAPLTGVAEVQRRLGHPREAIAAAERSIAIFAGNPTDTAGLADARFALAAALWDAHRDRPRALALAGQAREALADQPTSQRRLAEIDAWLAARTGAPPLPAPTPAPQQRPGTPGPHNQTPAP